MTTKTRSPNPARIRKKCVVLLDSTFESESAFLRTVRGDTLPKSEEVTSLILVSPIYRSLLQKLIVLIRKIRLVCPS